MGEEVGGGLLMQIIHDTFSIFTEQLIEIKLNGYVGNICQSTECA